MALSAITQPHTYMAAYSAVPLKLYSDQYNQQQLFKYIVNMTWDRVTISQDVSINIGNNIYTKLTSTTPHNFVIGDTVLVDDSINSNQFTGYYIVQQIVTPTQFAIDLIPDAPFTNSGFTVSKVIKWRLTPDLDGYGKIDLSNTMKDFVSQNLTGQSVNYALSYDAPNTKFNYQLYCGSESKYTFQFDDNLFSGGTVAFHSSGTTSLANVPFQIGDTIQVIQNVYEWPYTDNYFASGALGLTGTTTPPFLQGQQVTITGQQTFPYYNGLTSVGGIGVNSMYVDKDYQGNTPAEGGFVYGVPRPEYNTVATITSITLNPSLGVVINTNIPFTTSSPPIGGIIQYADGRITEQPIQLKLSGASIYNAHLNRNEYSVTGFDKYVVQNRSNTLNNISTILENSPFVTLPSNKRRYRVEPNTIGFLLTHTISTTYVDGMLYVFYGTNENTPLGQVFIPKSVSSQLDFYSPIGLQQIAGSPYVNVSGTFSGYSGSVVNYCMYAADTVAPGFYTQRTRVNWFTINPDCSMYEVYHLMWKDKNGSLISYPFIYMSRDNIEVERNTYYKQEGTWDNNSFQYYDYDDGEKNFYLQSRKSYILNSGWLYQFETALMDDLMQSPSVYIQTPDNRLYQCHIAQKDLELYKTINEQLFSYTFNVRVSNNEYRF
jgi:hypothetical protein